MHCPLSSFSTTNDPYASETIEDRIRICPDGRRGFGDAVVWPAQQSHWTTENVCSDARVRFDNDARDLLGAILFSELRSDALPVADLRILCAGDSRGLRRIFSRTVSDTPTSDRSWILFQHRPHSRRASADLGALQK